MKNPGISGCAQNDKISLVQQFPGGLRICIDRYGFAANIFSTSVTKPI